MLVLLDNISSHELLLNLRNKIKWFITESNGEPSLNYLSLWYLITICHVLLNPDCSFLFSIDQSKFTHIYITVQVKSVEEILLNSHSLVKCERKSDNLALLQPVFLLFLQHFRETHTDTQHCGHNHVKGFQCYGHSNRMVLLLLDLNHPTTTPPPLHLL